MNSNLSKAEQEELVSILDNKDQLSRKLDNFPWWFPVIILIFVWAIYIIASQDTYAEAFNFIKNGLKITIFTSLIAYLVAIMIGLVTGLGRISKNIVFRNVASLYVEIIRGIPMLVLIFYIALVAVPSIVNFLQGLGGPFSLISNKLITQNFRAIVALAVTYGAFLAEIFRAGIQSIQPGQMEAARSLGMTYTQSMRYVILPQAVRNVLPALGNDFVAMVKDSSLVSVLAVRDITQFTKVYTGRSFRYEEGYTTLAILYLSMTVILSLIIRVAEKRLRKDD